jgi:hypothetical protein
MLERSRRKNNKAGKERRKTTEPLEGRFTRYRVGGNMIMEQQEGRNKRGSSSKRE